MTKGRLHNIQKEREAELLLNAVKQGISIEPAHWMQSKEQYGSNLLCFF